MDIPKVWDYVTKNTTVTFGVSLAQEQKDFDSEYLEKIKYYCLVMSEEYIRNHFSDIKKYANVIENRLDDEWCTMESILSENAQMLEFAKKYNVNYILIEDKYEINIEL